GFGALHRRAELAAFLARRCPRRKKPNPLELRGPRIWICHRLPGRFAGAGSGVVRGAGIELIMERNIQKIGVINWFVLLLVGAVSAVVARYAASAAGAVGVVFLGIGFLIAIVSYFQLRLEARERLELMEYVHLLKSGGGSALFQ